MISSVAYGIWTNVFCFCVNFSSRFIFNGYFFRGSQISICTNIYIIKPFKYTLIYKRKCLEQYFCFCRKLLSNKKCTILTFKGFSKGVVCWLVSSKTQDWLHHSQYLLLIPQTEQPLVWLWSTSWSHAEVSVVLAWLRSRVVHHPFKGVCH